MSFAVHMTSTCTCPNSSSLEPWMAHSSRRRLPAILMSVPVLLSAFPPKEPIPYRMGFINHSTNRRIARYLPHRDDRHHHSFDAFVSRWGIGIRSQPTM